MATIHPLDDPEGLQALWDNADLPLVAYERLADGQYWSIPERPDPGFRVMSIKEAEEFLTRSIRVADFRAERERGTRRWAVVGMWRGQKEWWHVGWIEN